MSNQDFLRACPQCGSETQWHIKKTERGFSYYCEVCDSFFFRDDDAKGEVGKTKLKAKSVSFVKKEL